VGFWTRSTDVVNRLLYGDKIVEKMFKKAIGELKHTRNSVSDEFMEAYEKFAKRVRVWQKTYEHLKKKRAVASDTEYSNIRHDVAKAYEYILSPYHDIILDNSATLRQKFTYLDGALSYS